MHLIPICVLLKDISEYSGSSDVLPSDQARELAAIHDICIQHEDKLLQLSAAQVSPTVSDL